MRSLRKPNASQIEQFLAGQSAFDLTYDHVGATASSPPDGFVLDHTRVQLGTGNDVFLLAKEALQKWQQFQLGWVETRPANTPIVKGECVAVLARSFGLWWLNACRIVDVIDEALPRKRFGFAYGTLPDHVGSGEDRFLIEMDDAGDVWYDILAFSRPVRFLPRVGYRLMRRIQRRFGPESAAAMRRAVGDSTETLLEESRK